MDKKILAIAIVIIAFGSVFAYISLGTNTNGTNGGNGNGGNGNGGNGNGDPPPSPFDTMLLNAAINRRTSVWSHNTTLVSIELVETVLWSAYGSTTNGRAVESMCGGYPLVFYVSHDDGAYRYNASTGLLDPWPTGSVQGFPTDWRASPCWIIITRDRDVCTDVNDGYKEAGMVVQNVYLAANALNLGTVCISETYERDQVRASLQLEAANHELLLVMPLGFPQGIYANYGHLQPGELPASNELPEVQIGNTTLKAAIDGFQPSRSWSQNLTKQQLSQILWAGYGYSSYFDTEREIVHRSVPSAHGTYPSTLYVANASGLYIYQPLLHSLTMESSSDLRSDIATACDAVWLTDAPLLVLPVWEEYPAHDFYDTYGNIEVGLITQNIFLESHDQHLHADWASIANETAIRSTLNINSTTTHPGLVIALGA
jgi:hypothetical protein